MHDVDFLPAKYRDMSTRRNIKLSRVLVVGVIALGLVGAAVMQHKTHSGLVTKLETIDPLHKTAVRNSQELKATNAEFESEQKTAALITYMKHPWPRTQILSAVMKPLPEGISLDHVMIGREEMAPEKAIIQTGRRKKRVSKRNEEAEAAKLDPAERDLKSLREQPDKTQTVVTVSGRTQDRAAMYYYLSQLGESTLVVKAELKSVESVDQGQRGNFRATINELSSAKQPSKQFTKFVAKLVIRQGHGQKPPKAEEDEEAKT